MNFRFLITFFVLFLFANMLLFAQENKKNVGQDTLKIDKDSLGKDEIEETINYSAKDSIRFNVVSQIIYLYGSAKIKFGQTELSANYIEIDQFKNQVMAKGTYDSATKKNTGDPIFVDKGTTYNAKVINYNFKTKKGVISGTSTKQGEGNIVSETVKRDLNGNLYARYNLYTTCDLPHPHFGIRSQRMKIIPGKVTASGPFFLEMGGVPTPLGFFFGLFPQPGGKASGFLMPQYGETRERGFFLANGGLYLAISNYVDARITGEMYSKGGYGFNVISNYKSRYKFDGNINFRYNVRENEVAGSLEKAIGKDFSLTWSHTPKGRGKGKFSANVNIATSNFNQRNAPDARSYLSSSLNSNIQYNTSFLAGKITLGTSLRHEQNIITKVASVLPSVELRVTRITPFAKLSTKKNLLTSLNMSYTMSTSATITNVRQGTASFPFTAVGLSNVRDTIGFNLANINQLIENTKTGMTHVIPISTSARVLKYFDLSLGFNYKEVWYPENYDYQYLGRDSTFRNINGVDTTVRVQKDTVHVRKNKEFSRFNDYGISVSLTTRIYGTYFPKIGRIQAIRHIINPNISLSYRPDFSKSSYGFYENVQSREFISAGGMYAPNQYVNTSRYQGTYGQPSSGESASMNISITNTLEAKMKSKYDSIKKPEKLTLLNFTLNSGYNFLAKEYKLSNISLSANTTAGKFNFSLSSNIDPYFWKDTIYTREGQGEITEKKRVNEYAIMAGNTLGNITNANFAISTSFSGKKKAEKKVIPKNEEEEAELKFINANRDLYVDFNIPWTLSINYNLNYNAPINVKSSIVQALSLNGSISLTPKWNVTYNSGYDFVNKQVSFTQFSINRDLHCWRMSVTWIPFGPRQGYTFDIGVKSTILQDLKLSKRNSWYYR